MYHCFLKIVCAWFSFRPVHGLIFLFKWKADDEPQGTIVHDTRRQSIFFAKQVSAISEETFLY